MKSGYKIFFGILAICLVVGIVLLIRSGSKDPSAPPTTDPQAAAELAANAPPPKPKPPPKPAFALRTTDDTATTLPAAIQALAAKDLTGCLADAKDGRILWHHNAETLVPIASMTKIMTTLVAMEEIERRDDLSLETGVKITQAAMDIGGSQVYLGKDEVFTLAELLQATMIHSANDCAYAVSEAVGPNFSSKDFVQLMNRRARELGMAKTRFFNPHGLPESDPERDCRATAAELVILGKFCLDRPQIMEWAGTWHHPFRPNAKEPLIMQNRNKLVDTCPGVNGLKTGYIRRSGFCVTATCTRNGRTLILCVTGFPSSIQRNAFVTALLDWAYTRP